MRGCRRKARRARGTAEWIVLFCLLVVVLALTMGMGITAVSSLTVVVEMEHLAEARNNATSGTIKARKRFEPVVRARIQALFEAINSGGTSVDLRSAFLADLELPDFEYGPVRFGEGEDSTFETVTRFWLVEPPGPVTVGGDVWPVATDANGPHAEQYHFAYRTVSTGRRGRARVVHYESGSIYVPVKVDALESDTIALGATGGIPGGVGDIGGGAIGSAEEVTVTAGQAASGDRFGPPVISGPVSMGLANGNRVYAYLVRGLAGAGGGPATVEATFNGRALRARVALQDGWRRQSNYDPGTDSLLVPSPDGSGMVPMAATPNYGVVLVEGPPPSHFFEATGQAGYVRAVFDKQTYDDGSFEPPSILLKLPGIGEYSLQQFSVAECKPNVEKLEAGYDDDWHAVTFSRLVVNSLGNYDVGTSGGILLGRGWHPEGENVARYTSGGVEYTAQVALDGQKGPVTSTWVSSVTGTTASNTIGFGYNFSTWSTGDRPVLAMNGSSLSVKSFPNVVNVTIRGRTAAGSFDPDPNNEVRLAIAAPANLMPSGMAGGSGIVRPPTHLRIREYLIAVVPEASWFEENVH